jgi:hypothetical protein
LGVDRLEEEQKEADEDKDGTYSLHDIDSRLKYYKPE